MGQWPVKIKVCFRTQVLAAFQRAPILSPRGDNGGSGRHFAGQAACTRNAVVPHAKAGWFWGRCRFDQLPCKNLAVERSWLTAGLEPVRVFGRARTVYLDRAPRRSNRLSAGYCFLDLLVQVAHGLRRTVIKWVLGIKWVPGLLSHLGGHIDRPCGFLSIVFHRLLNPVLLQRGRLRPVVAARQRKFSPIEKPMLECLTMQSLSIVTR